MATFGRKLKVNRTDAFVFNISGWLSTEEVTSLTVTNADGLVTIVSSDINGANLEVLLTGVTEGSATLHFDYTTATRNNCDTATVKVVANC